MATSTHPFILHERRHIFHHVEDIDVDDDENLHRSRHHRSPSGSEEKKPHIPPIPDLRYEFSYLRSIRKCLDIRYLDSAEQPHISSSSSTHQQHLSLSQEPSGGAESEEYEKIDVSNTGSDQGAVKTAIQVAPTTLEKNPTFTIMHIAWCDIFWITARDQILSPFLQGMLWGVAGAYLAPLMKRIFPGKEVKKPPVKVRTMQDKLKAKVGYKDGQLTQWLREKVNKLGFTAPTVKST